MKYEHLNKDKRAQISWFFVQVFWKDIWKPSQENISLFNSRQKSWQTLLHSFSFICLCFSNHHHRWLSNSEWKPDFLYLVFVQYWPDFNCSNPQCSGEAEMHVVEMTEPRSYINCPIVANFQMFSLFFLPSYSGGVCWSCQSVWRKLPPSVQPVSPPLVPGCPCLLAVLDLCHLCPAS